MASGAIGAQALGTILLPGPIPDMGRVQNPTGVPALASIAQTLIEAGSIALLACLPFSVLAPVVRFRRGRAVERQQLKWFGSASGLAAICLFVAATVPPPFAVPSWMVMTVAVGFVPVVIAVAILRYRLFEIDRLISRTVAYAIVTAVLALTFVVTNVALQAILADLDRQLDAHHRRGHPHRRRPVPAAPAPRPAGGRPPLRSGTRGRRDRGRAPRR